MIKSVDKGIFAVSFGGGQVDITSGKFVFSCTEAYEIINGKIGLSSHHAIHGNGINTVMVKNVDFIENVSYNVVGGAFQTESGDEIGSFVRNIALRTVNPDCSSKLRSVRNV